MRGHISCSVEKLASTGRLFNQMLLIQRKTELSKGAATKGLRVRLTTFFEIPIIFTMWLTLSKPTGGAMQRLPLHSHFPSRSSGSTYFRGCTKSHHFLRTTPLSEFPTNCLSFRADGSSKKDKQAKLTQPPFQGRQSR